MFLCKQKINSRDCNEKPVKFKNLALLPVKSDREEALEMVIKGLVLNCGLVVKSAI